MGQDQGSAGTEGPEDAADAVCVHAGLTRQAPLTFPEGHRGVVPEIFGFVTRNGTVDRKGRATSDTTNADRRYIPLLPYLGSLIYSHERDRPQNAGSLLGTAP